MSVLSKNKIFVVIVIACILAMIVGIGWLIRYAFIRFNDEVELNSSSQVKDEEIDESLLDKIVADELPERVVVSIMDDIETDVHAVEQSYYDKAYGLFYNNKNEESIESCLIFLRRYSHSVLRDDIEFLLAANYRSKEQYKKAVNQLAKVIVDYPNSSSISSAYYEIARLYKNELDREEDALSYYIECLKNIRRKDEFPLEHAIDAVEELSDIEVRMYNEPEPTEEPISSNAKIGQNGAFAFESDDILSIMYTDNDRDCATEWDYEYDNYSVHCVSSQLVSNYSKTICFLEKGSKDVTCIILICDIDYYYKDDTKIKIKLNKLLIASGVSRDNADVAENELIGSNIDKGEAGEVTYDDVTCEMSWIEDDLIFKIYPQMTNMDISSLPLKIERNQDFLKDDERRTLVKESLDSYDYAKIVELANEYIENEEPGKSDTVFEILKLAEENSELIKNCDITYDKVDKEYTVHYKGVDRISKYINIVPFMEDNYFNVIVGFVRSNWLFAERYEIATDEEKNITGKFSYNNVCREVLSSSLIIEYEAENSNIYKQEINQIISCEEPILRFIGENDRYIDHVITDMEKEALQAMVTLRLNYVDLSDIIFWWENVW